MFFSAQKPLGSMLGKLPEVCRLDEHGAFRELVKYLTERGRPGKRGRDCYEIL